MKRVLLLFIAILTLMTASLPAGAAEKITIMLDWFPNVDHLPIYVAQQEGFFTEAGLDVEILSPSETSDALKLAVAGKVDIAVSYEPQTIIAASEGLKLRVIGRLVGHPLTTLLFMKDQKIDDPAELSGKKLGYTVPGMMDVLLEAFAKLNGIEDYEAVNVGFTIVPALASNKVAAVMGPFKTYETVSMKEEGCEPAFFELEKHGIPDYDELIFVAGPKLAAKRQKALKAFVAAVERGIEVTRSNPERALENYFKALPDADRKIESEAFNLTLPYYAENQHSDPARWQNFADFALKYGLIDEAVDTKSLLN